MGSSLGVSAREYESYLLELGGLAWSSCRQGLIRILRGKWLIAWKQCPPRECSRIYTSGIQVMIHIPEPSFSSLVTHEITQTRFTGVWARPWIAHLQVFQSVVSFQRS